MRRGFLAAVACTALALVGADSAWACACAEITSDSIGKTDVAIVARLTATEIPPEEAGELFPDTVYRYRVIEELKGEKRISRRNIRVHDALPGSDCTMEAIVGKRYGLILGRDDRRWEGTLCSQTIPGRLRNLFDDRDTRIRVDRSVCRG